MRCCSKHRKKMSTSSRLAEHKDHTIRDNITFIKDWKATGLGRVPRALSKIKILDTSIKCWFWYQFWINSHLPVIKLLIGSTTILSTVQSIQNCINPARMSKSLVRGYFVQLPAVSGKSSLWWASPRSKAAWPAHSLYRSEWRPLPTWRPSLYQLPVVDGSRIRTDVDWCGIANLQHQRNQIIISQRSIFWEKNFALLA